jgi:competence protein ComEC
LDGPKQLEVSVLDVGQGDAILIQTPSGRHILVDGGPSGSVLAQALGRELPASMRRLDLVVLTHGHDDHVTGLISLLERYKVGTALMSPVETDTQAYREWRDDLKRHRIAVHTAIAGEWLDLGEGVRLEVRSPPPGLPIGALDDVNDNAVVLRLVFRNISFLLTGDIEAIGEESLIAAGGDLHATVLKLAHHGSDGSTTQAFIAAVRPRFGVISVGDNTYGHPSPGTQLRLAGIPYLRTDENGRVRFRTDGASVWTDYDRGRLRFVPPGGF